MRLKFIVILILLSLVTGALAGGYVAFSRALPTINELKEYEPSSGTKIYADNDTLIGELKAEKGIFVSIDRIPQHVVNAIVAVEDSRFWEHKGIDYVAIARALLKDIIHARIKEGGSTITQQLAKVVFLTPEKTVKRKLMEAVLALKIENTLSKKEILELYLNRIYFGHGAYGIEMAARTYFGKSVDRLNRAESSLLVGLTKAPATYSPFNNLRKAKGRQLTVLMRMEDEGYISREEKDETYNQPLYLSSLKEGAGGNGYFIEYVRKHLEEKYGVNTVYRGGLKVYTTLNRRMQGAAVNALQEGLRTIDKRRGWRGPVAHKDNLDINKELAAKELTTNVVIHKGGIYSGLVLRVTRNEALVKTRGVTGKLYRKDSIWASKVLDARSGKTKSIRNFTLDKILKAGDVVKVSIKSIRGRNVLLSLEQEPEIEGALVAIEPYTGFLRALVGGYNFSKSEFNRALFAKRPPGSAFKPVIYAAAMDNGYTPASIVIDEPVTYMKGQEGEWSPENYDHEYNGPTRLREALTYSRNVVTVKLADSMGLDTVKNYAKVLGFQERIPRDLSISLGSFNTSPLELATVYNTFASNGMKVRPISIKYVVDKKGRVYESNEPAPEQLISPQTAFLITSMLEDVVKYGTGWRARGLGRPVAGKTGTTDDYKDAWFVGYTPHLTASVWVGFDNFQTLGTEETGARAASPIWVAFMNNAVRGKSEEFIPPEGIVSSFIDPETGLLSYADSGLREYFKEDTQPTEFSPTQSIWEVRDPSQFNFD